MSTNQQKSQAVQLPALTSDPYSIEIQKKALEQDQAVESLRAQLLSKSKNSPQTQGSPRITDLKLLSRQLQEERQVRVKSYRVKEHAIEPRQRSAEGNRVNNPGRVAAEDSKKE